MTSVIDNAKHWLWLGMSALAAAFTPVENIMHVLAFSFIFNIILGIASGIHVDKEKFSSSKAFNALGQLMFWAILVVFLDYISKKIPGSDPDLGVKAVKWLTYIVIYFYLTNIFKNAHKIWPRNEAIKFIYELLSTEIFNRLTSHLTFKNKIND